MKYYFFCIVAFWQILDICTRDAQINQWLVCAMWVELWWCFDCFNISIYVQINYWAIAQTIAVQWCVLTLWCSGFVRFSQVKTEGYLPICTQCKTLSKSLKCHLRKHQAKKWRNLEPHRKEEARQKEESKDFIQPKEHRSHSEAR